MDFSLIKPQITFNESLDNIPFQTLMTDYSSTIGPGIQLGKENGLSLLLGKNMSCSRIKNEISSRLRYLEVKMFKWGFFVLQNETLSDFWTKT